MSGDSRDPYIRPEEAVIPPPPPEIPIPEGLIPPPPSESAIPDAVIPPPPSESAIPDAVIPPPPSESAIPDAVIPPPPPEAMLPSTRRSRPKPAILTGDQPAPVADDWAQPSVAPEAPTSGGYGALTFVIFAFLLVLLGAAIAGAIYLGTTVSFALPAGGSETIAAGTGVPWHG
ncbi:hypothetical protein ACIP5T_13235 [Microbacterium sp. NPDC088619]|uniref:hypothetical protein n=1 Tax=Microbacterium sp. NPDC088619 TaxID=3364196 RepID=UPI003828C66F